MTPTQATATPDQLHAWLESLGDKFLGDGVRESMRASDILAALRRSSVPTPMSDRTRSHSVHPALPGGEVPTAASRSSERATNGSELRAQPSPIDMLLFCPDCGEQHIDAPEGAGVDLSNGVTITELTVWDNPPHKSHLCHMCGCIWRPADVPTNGVAALTTTGKADTWKLGSGAIPSAPASLEALIRSCYDDAARFPEMEDPRTSDWMYDDNHDCAEAIRKRGEQTATECAARASLGATGVPTAEVRLPESQIRALMLIANRWAGPDESDSRSDYLEMALRALRVATSSPAPAVAAITERQDSVHPAADGSPSALRAAPFSQPSACESSELPVRPSAYGCVVHGLAHPCEDCASDEGRHA